MFRHRVAEFEGAGELLEAADVVLREPRVDLAIVRNVAGVAGIGYHQTEAGEMIPTTDTAREIRQILHARVPEIPALATVVNDFWADFSFDHPEGSTCRINRNLDDPNRYRSTVIWKKMARHVDHFELGPLVMSARIDPYTAMRRYFYARKRPGVVVITGEGERDEEPHHTAKKLHMLGLSRVEQKPSDIVFIATTPQVTPHMTRIHRPWGSRQRTKQQQPRAFVEPASITWMPKRPWDE